MKLGSDKGIMWLSRGWWFTKFENLCSSWSCNIYKMRYPKFKENVHSKTSSFLSRTSYLYAIGRYSQILVCRLMFLSGHAVAFVLQFFSSSSIFAMIKRNQQRASMTFYLLLEENANKRVVMIQTPYMEAGMSKTQLYQFSIWSFVDRHPTSFQFTVNLPKE